VHRATPAGRASLLLRRAHTLGNTYYPQLAQLDISRLQLLLQALNDCSNLKFSKRRLTAARVTDTAMPAGAG
jgi:hypothetical protein